MQADLEKCLAQQNAVYKQDVEALNFFPVSTQGDAGSLFTTDNPYIVCPALFYKNGTYYVRLHNSSPNKQICTLSSKRLELDKSVTFGEYAFVTLYNKNGMWQEADLSLREHYIINEHNIGE